MENELDTSVIEPAVEETISEEEPLSEEPAAEEPVEEKPAAEEPPKPDYLRMTINSCIQPLEMRFSQINSCYRKKPIAYRSFTYINSVIQGVVPPEKYSYAADGTDRGKRLAIWNIEAAMHTVEAMILAGRHIEFVSARISPKLVNEPDFYGFIQGIIEKNQFQFPDLICLEFPRTALYEDEEQLRMAILSMKLLKVKTMLAGCGQKDSPVTQLINLPFDYVLLAPWMSALVGDRSKGAALEAFIGFLRDLPCGVICEGARDDDQVSLMSRADCFGYIPARDYVGLAQHGRLRMTLDEAVAQKEEDEY